MEKTTCSHTSITIYDNQPATRAEAQSYLKILCGCYRQSEVADPMIFNEAALRIMCNYPVDILKAVTNPGAGLPAKLKWFPSLAELKEALETLMEPRRQYEDKLQRRAEQLNARDEWLKPPTGPRKTAAEILRSFEEAGFKFGSQKKRITVRPEEFMQRYGISRAEFDALGTSKAP
jgi:hypothetical protein